MTQKMLVTIYPDGKTEKEDLTEHPPLDKLQKIVDGYIERVPFFNTYGGEPCLAFCNEYGKMQNKPMNYPATKQWEQALGRRPDPDFLVGNIVIIVGPREWLGAM